MPRFIMAANAFIINLRTCLHDELRDAIIQQAPNRFCSIVTDAEKDIGIRADIVGAKYWMRIPCTGSQWNVCSSIIESIRVHVGICKWTSGGNNNRRVRIVAGINVISEVLNAPWVKNYVGDACTIDGRNRHVIVGSIPKTTSITDAGISLRRSWNGKVVNSNEDNVDDNECNNDDGDNETIPVLRVLFNGLCRGRIERKLLRLNVLLSIVLMLRLYIATNRFWSKDRPIVVSHL